MALASSNRTMFRGFPGLLNLPDHANVRHRKLQGARASIDDTQGADAGSIIENERTASVEPNSGFIDNERVVGKSFVLECVRNNQRFTIINHVGTKCGVARCLFHI
jgi:hypothetical protein